ncbi:SigE family RNA polymerase sigma factor [Motilibacter aurantiacus]|uniref:SigE family RNA polymerase sigma factor n=1 Tax=Motilibacter aurantiacus TaxID=2714955 RepID=UPI0014092DB7|nr:SigE family RNA polymerase sigma factor [Motilibacter aurantiacus]
MGAADDEREFSDFVAHRQRALLRTAYLLTGDRHTAEDLLQAALTKTFLSWGRIDDLGAAEAYVRTTLTRTYVSWWRRRWRGEHPTEELPEPVSSGAALDTAVAERADLWDVVQTLPRRQRAAVVLRFYEDMSEAQVAEVLGCSVGTVKSQTSRALATLRARMTVPADEEGAR